MKRPAKAHEVAWKRALSHFEAAQRLLQKHNEMECSPLWGEFAQQCYEAQTALLALPAPDYEGIFKKIILLWIGESWGDKDEIDQQEIILEDIWRLTGWTKPKDYMFIRPVGTDVDVDEPDN